MKKKYHKEKNTAPFKIKIFLTLLTLFFGLSTAFSQGASCATAVGLTVNAAAVAGLASDTTVNDPVAATCITGSLAQDGWYSFQATSTTATVTVVSNNRQLVIYAYSGTCGSLTQISCANANTAAGGQTEVMNLTGLVATTTYYIRVGNTGAGSSITLNAVSVSTPITNDNCSGAIGLTVNPGTTCTTSTNGTTVGATQSQAGCSGTADDDVWYSFVASAAAQVITVTPNTLNNAVFEVFPGNACGSLGTGVCVNNTSGGNAEVASISGFTVGLTYYVRVYSQGNASNAGTFSICVTSPPSNNQCSGAVSLPCGTTNLAGTTIGTASIAHNTACGMSNYGVWYTFVGDGNQSIISVTTTNFDVEMSISSGSCGALTNIACTDAAFTSGTETFSVNTVIGTTYYVYVADYLTGGTTIGNFTISRACVAPLTNDECSGAIALTATTTCSYTTYSNSGATASTGMTAPGCASYSGGDVWFSVVVPVTGEIDVDLQTGTMTDSGVAFYSGTCGALTLLDCDDDSSANGLMSYLTRTGLTPGQTIYIRVWEYGNDNNGTFGICVTTPSCPSPSDLNASVLSSTSVTVSWTASTPTASGGYQYYINTTNVAPTAATTPTGSTLPGVISVTLTGLTPGLKYYFWVRSYCGGSDTSTWFGPTNYTPCAVGNGTGTTSLTCPSVLTGGVGMSGGNPADLTCSALTCTSLEATYLQLNQPTNYAVTSIPYSPPYQFTCLQNPVSVNIDDVWSPTINLPFNFCFYGNNYNKCLIGSNGVISFDTTTYGPGGYNEWQFTNNLPSASLIRNAIFGVYHDIDPSKGGQVGYELITLNTGCRALVASWNDIPMYSSACNSVLYTGMIVLYENTNVIEVYVKEKNVCGTWNGGNAVIGLQNAAGNAAVVAPNRNSLDTNWTVTNEAWRFTPSGSSLTTIQWYEGSVATGTPISAPASVTVGDISTSTISVCPTTTTTYTAEITYTRCNGILKFSDNAVVTVTGNKIWNGTVSQDWNTSNNWTPAGVPTSANCVIVPVTANNPVISNTPDGVGYNLAVYNGAQLTVNSNKNLTITDKVTVQPTGIFTLNNSASLIQINNILNSGNIIYKRTSPNIRTFDYVYWSSPVANFNISNIVAPYTFGPIYHWNTTIANANGGQGTWQNFSGNMVTGKGYIARAPGTAPFNNSTFNPLNGTFTGVPNNGNITLPIERGNDQNTANHYGTNGVQITNLSDNWNLLGNPYPSAIRGSQFLFDNNTKIEGNIRLWTHGNLPVYTTNPFYNSFVYNYTSGDYLTYNFTGTSCCPAASSDLFIGSGQGFFVQMIDGPQVLAASNVTVAFNNNQRSAGFDNSIFYKNAIPNFNNESFNVNDLERNRIWLDIINPNGQSDRTLFGYIENATMGTDSFFDCITQNSGGTLIFSETGDTKFNIQGRSLPFDVNDEVPIGINAPAQGEYTIGIAAVDGLFDNQDIFLKDDLLNITHNLKTSPYHFTTQSGGIYDRFKVVYVDNTLGIPTHTFDDNNIKVITNNEVAVSSSNLSMESVIVYNLLGQKLDEYDNLNSNYVILSNLNKTNTTLLLKIKLQTGEIVTRKIIF